MSTGYPFAVPETRLSEALGLPRKAIKDVRTDVLTQGEDWDYCKLERNHGAVVFSRVGIEKTLVALGIPLEKISLLLPPSADGPPSAPPAAPAPLPAAPPPSDAAAPPETCEGCGDPAVTSDVDGVALCAACAATCDEDDLAPNESPSPTLDDVFAGIPLLFERHALICLLAARAAGADPAPSLDLTAPDVVEVTLTRIYAVNRRIVAGTVKGEPVRVRVRSSEKLRVNMILRCTRIERDLYELAERLPRRIPTV